MDECADLLGHLEAFFPGGLVHSCFLLLPAGLFCSGAMLSKLGQFYAAAIVNAKPPLEFDVIFGPAYKVEIVATHNATFWGYLCSRFSVNCSVFVFAGGKDSKELMSSIPGPYFPILLCISFVLSPFYYAFIVLHVG